MGLADSTDVGRVQLNSIELKETPVHDFFVGFVFIAMVMTPCVVALMTRVNDN